MRLEVKYQLEAFSDLKDVDDVEVVLGLFTLRFGGREIKSLGAMPFCWVYWIYSKRPNPLHIPWRALT